ncbi:hypothetical protein QC758_19475, partial [Halomonas campisalis]|uniref:hypothetical protein n=1 Tax=Billgrantia campisalis TaxID=74661 RepID=UPI0028606B3E
LPAEAEDAQLTVMGGSILLTAGGSFLMAIDIRCMAWLCGASGRNKLLNLKLFAMLLRVPELILGLLV